MSKLPIQLDGVDIHRMPKRKRRILVPNSPTNHRVMTPLPLAAQIIAHFKPTGNLLDPCRGEGAFFNQFPQDQFREWCEIDEGRNFFTFDFAGRQYDWCVSNPPFSLFRAFTIRAMELGVTNIVWLCTVNAIFMRARLRDLDDAGYGIKEIARVDQPPRPWPASGLELAALHIQKGWVGDIKFGRLT